jgi:methyl-accepting chemotaxis protein
MEIGMKKFIANLKLSRKLLIAPAVVVLFLIAFGLVSFNGLVSEKDALNDIFNNRFKTFEKVAGINEDISIAHGAIYKLITWARANYDGSKLDALGKAEVKRIDDAIATLAHFTDSTASEEMRNRYAKAVQLAGDYRKAAFMVVDFATIDLNVATISMSTAEEKYSSLSAALHTIRDQELKESEQSYEMAAAGFSRVMTLFVIIFGSAIGLSIVVSVYINKLILAPVAETTEAINVVSTGNLTKDVPVRTSDEIGEMSSAFNRMLASLRELIGEVTASSSAQASAASQISSSTEQMAAGAQEQTSQASEVASAVEEMSKTIVENSQNASATASTARQAREAAEDGGRVVFETINGMKNIAGVVKRSAATVAELGKSSDQIGAIIGVIDDIADQTNLLALNAAIEAARAGEQGRGFAVVADEVRKLAERTTKATKEIADMIKKIQTDTRGAVSSMDEGTRQVDKGIELAEKAGKALTNIVAISQSVTDKVTQIAAASEQQSSASEQISKNVEAISAVTNESAMGVQQIARAAEDLNRLTENLQHILGRFTLADGLVVQSAPEKHKTRAVHTPTSGIAVQANGSLVSHT